MNPYFSQQFKNTTVLCWFVVIGLALLAIGYLIQAAAGVGQIVSPNASINGDLETVGSVWLMFQLLVMFVRFPIFVITVVLFLVWLHRSATNLFPLRSQHREFDPGWMIGWWFIPIAFLFKPYQAVREVWRESDPVLDTSQGFLLTGGPITSPLLGWWWLFWITSFLTTNVAIRLFDPDGKNFVDVTTGLFTLSGVLSFAAALLAIVVVRSITKRQVLRLAAVSLLPPQFSGPPTGNQPPPPPAFGSVGRGYQ